MNAESTSDIAVDVVETRCLRGDEEVENWLDFVAECFRVKGTPRSYFKRHVETDETFNANHVFVVVEKSKTPTTSKEREGEKVEEGEKDVFVSTCRVFERKVVINGEEISLGGIGEVCTHPERRKRGYARICMNKAIEFMKEYGYNLSSLHSCQPHLQAYYKRFNYVSCPMYYQTLTLAFDASSDKTADDCTGVSLGDYNKIDTFAADDNNHDVLNWMRSIHEQQFTSSSSSFNGTVVRTNNYWRNWIVHELQSTQEPQPTVHIFPEHKGYAIIQHRSIRGDGVFQVREFAYDSREHEKGKDEQESKYLLTALQQARALAKDGQTSSHDSFDMKINIAVPLIPLGFEDCVKVLERKSIVDGGWMYRIINENSAQLKRITHTQGSAKVTDLALQHALHGVDIEGEELEGLSHHMFFNIDAF
eukprot:m.108139 g.108139  ORF g.108139 m.108139 type:complete len:420 (+) comp12700_c0_seq4:151-1410(+)